MDGFGRLNHQLDSTIRGDCALTLNPSLNERERGVRYTENLTAITPCVIIQSMIKTFADKETEKLFQRQRSRFLPVDIQHKARLKLEILDAAEKLDDLKVPPGNRLEKLSGDREGQYSIRINQQWRICFRWKNGDCYEVEIVDYH